MSGLYGLVLIGGKSSRMGTDKALIEYHGKPHALHLRDLLGKYCAKVFFSAKDSQTVPQVLRHETTLFDPPELGGPAAGIMAALRAHPDKSWLVLACDLPHVDEKGLQQLIRARDVEQNATVYCSPQGELPEPVYAIYEPSALQAFERCLQSDLRCPRKILLQSKTKMIQAYDPDILTNANHPQERDVIMDKFRMKNQSPGDPS